MLAENPSGSGLYAMPVRPAGATGPTEVVCPVCGPTRGRAAYEIGDSRAVVICTACGTGSLQPAPTPNELSAFYPDSYYGRAGRKFGRPTEAAVGWLAHRRARRLTRGLPRGARILDVGCGRGLFLERVSELGLEAWGTERDASACPSPPPRWRTRIAERLPDAGFPAGHFHLVVLWHVLEHLAEPREDLIEAVRLLVPGGRLVIAVPNLESWQARWSGPHWFHLDPPRHLVHFPLSALRHLLVEIGLEVVRVEHFSLRQNPFGWLQSALNRVGRWPRNELYERLLAQGEGRARPGTLVLRALYLALLPAALLLALLEAAAGRGGTVTVVARKPLPDA